LENKEFLNTVAIEPGRGTMVGRVLLDGKTVHMHDIQADPDYKLSGVVALGGYRTMLGVPLLRQGEPIGVLVLVQSAVRPFTDKQIELATTFADQAVIAIENLRLFDEVQARTRDLAESLQQQTATADVLKVISRSTFDLQTVLQTLVESAARLCDADKTIITRQKNGVFYRAEAYGFSREFMDYVRGIPIEPEGGSAFGRALLEGRAVHIPDVKADPAYTLVEGQRLGDYRTVLAVPMVREGVPTGVLSLTRSEMRPFTEKQIELASTFADHGKRADAIVKNMLLHSREGSGEHRLVDINALVEESRNLAYHGARAEKQGFNITFERSLDPTAGEADVFPQDITRVLLNLISNGFYAATKRKVQADNDGYEPTLAVATKNLGDRVEIRIRDNGTGIPPEVKEKMFNPFFTTKPAGEGTGLGLSISHDIVVKQHSGSIEIDTQPGEFTEFKIILPRVAATTA
jgi:signal transduction histidine kinase